MTRFLLNSRYLIIVPIVGLALAAAFFFVFGGIGLLKLLYEYLLIVFGMTPKLIDSGSGVFIFKVVEHVHMFLIGTVLFITAVGFYQLFIDEITFPHWLQIDSTEELETNLIGVTVVVLAVQFMGFVFTYNAVELRDSGIGIAVTIAALSLFVGLRTWSTSKAKRSDRELDLIDEHVSEFHN